MMILVVDDEQPVLQMIKALLELERYTVMTAPDGAEALELARTNRPDVILSDLFMPGLDGPALHQELEGSEQTRAIPIIFMSGTKSPPPGLPGPFLRKPFEIDQLIKTIRGLL